MKEVIAEIVRREMKSAKPVEFVEAVVVQAPPSISVKIEGNSKLIYPSALITVAESLVKRSYDASISGLKSESDINGTNAKITFKDSLNVGDRVIAVKIQGGQKLCILDKLVSY